MATLVKFRVHPANEDLFAYFPNLNYFRENNLTKQGYAHIGQHSPVSVDYIKETRPATREEFEPLKRELESIGYNLKICK